LAASQPASKTRSGGEKSGSPTLKLIESGIPSAKAKKRRIPDGFMRFRRSAGANLEIKRLRLQTPHERKERTASLKSDPRIQNRIHSAQSAVNRK
jgi:hypothetical protein